MALHMALVLHELGTNAAKYGALSTEEGRIDLNWTIQDGTLHLMWRESGGPAVQPPSRRGFGTMLLERSLKSDGGTVQGDYAPEGVTWKITLPTPDPAEISLPPPLPNRSEEHTSELQSLMRISYAVFCLKKKKK